MSSQNIKISIQLAILLILVLFINLTYVDSSNAYSGSGSSIVQAIFTQRGFQTSKFASPELEPPYVNLKRNAETFRKISHPIITSKIDTIPYNNSEEENSLTNAQLQKLSTRLRDIARYAGSSSPATVSIRSTKDNDSLLDLVITDIKDMRNQWVSLGVGQALKVVSEEIIIVREQLPQKKQDFLVYDHQTKTYHPLRDYPLDKYCHNLVNKYLK